MSFEEKFTQGIEYRKHFDPEFKLDEDARNLLAHTFKQTSKKAMQEPFFSIRQGICSEATKYAADNSVEPFAYQCLADSHTFLQACLEQGFVDERYMTLTVGDVTFEGQRLFNSTRQTIEDCVSMGISTIDTPKFHVWLTLVDMTIIDLTIVSQLLVDKRLPKPESPDQWLNVWRPERKGKYEYHPILVDDDFLVRLQKRPH
ncbi:MAG: hypothetical protein AB8B64_15530 [Granulosicoccus sp.]